MAGSVAILAADFFIYHCNMDGVTQADIYCISPPAVSITSGNRTEQRVQPIGKKKYKKDCNTDSDWSESQGDELESVKGKWESGKWKH
jgi:hypothetical protein